MTSKRLSYDRGSDFNGGQDLVVRRGRSVVLAATVAYAAACTIDLSARVANSIAAPLFPRAAWAVAATLLLLQIYRGKTWGRTAYTLLLLAGMAGSLFLFLILMANDGTPLLSIGLTAGRLLVGALVATVLWATPSVNEFIDDINNFGGLTYRESSSPGALLDGAAPPKPGSQREDRYEESVRRGQQIVLAIAIAYTLLSLVEAALWTHYTGTRLLANRCIRCVLSALFVYFLWRGHNWARVAWTVLFAIGLVSLTPTVLLLLEVSESSLANRQQILWLVCANTLANTLVTAALWLLPNVREFFLDRQMFRG